MATNKDPKDWLEEDFGTRRMMYSGGKVKYVHRKSSVFVQRGIN